MTNFADEYDRRVRQAAVESLLTKRPGVVSAKTPSEFEGLKQAAQGLDGYDDDDGCEFRGVDIDGSEWRVLVRSR